jgi:formamidopyrimidine-DNA glycosylase
MPELPEVHTISSDLDKHLSGFKIIDVEITPKYNAVPDNKTFVKAVRGKKIKKVSRVAKNILIELDSDGYVVFHLAMTGRLLLRLNKQNEDKWVKILFTVKKGEKVRYLKFTDMRTFGKAELLDMEGVKKLINKYGPEPLNENITPEEFMKIIRSKRTNIKNALLDQQLMSGLGNIYANDTLFIARVHPETKTSDITPDLAQRLLSAAQEILQEGIKNRGSTLPDKMYMDIFGKPGKQQDNFRVYMRETCPNCSEKIEFIKLNGRGTYFCPTCQV